MLKQHLPLLVLQLFQLFDRRIAHRPQLFQLPGVLQFEPLLLGLVTLLLFFLELEIELGREIRNDVKFQNKYKNIVTLQAKT